MLCVRHGRSGRECACRPRAPAAAMARAPCNAQAGMQAAGDMLFGVLVLGRACRQFCVR